MPAELHRLFNQQRRRLRQVLGWELVARVVTALAVAYWVGLALDWYFEPTPDVRKFVMGAACLGVLVWVARATIEPLFRPITNRQLASLIENRWPQLKDSLLTTIDLADPDSDASYPSDCDPSLAEETRLRAIAVLDEIGDPRIVLPTRAQRWTRYALLGMLSIAGFYAANSEAAGTYARRLALSPEAWPRRVVLVLEGFNREDDGVWRKRIARGDGVDIAVLASLTDGHKRPDTVWLWYDFEEGPRGREALAMIGQPTAGADASQRYETRLDEIRTNVTLRIRAEDGRVEPIEVIVAARPVISQSDIEVTPPGYLESKPWRAPVAAMGEIDEGSTYTLQFSASKPLAAVVADWAFENAGPSPEVVLVAGEQHFELVGLRAEQDGVLNLSLVDTDGIESAEPHPVAIGVRPDSLPRVALKLVGVSTAITPDAQIGLLASLEDDHGIASAQIDLAIDEQSADPIVIDLPSDKKSHDADIALDLLTERYESGRNAGRLEPGQQLLLNASASDAFNLREENRTVASQHFVLEVITADQLLARVEQREVNLRRTFEQTTSEMRRLTRSLSRKADKSGETESEAVADQEETDSARRLQVVRMIDQVSKVTQETRSVGESFQAIHLELVYNRIQNTDLLERIDARIAQPLVDLCDRELSTLRSGLELVRASDDLTPGARVIQQANVCLEEMERVLEQMKSLETYNEVLALLRQVIDDQQRVQRATERTRKQQLRRMLLD